MPSRFTGSRFLNSRFLRPSERQAAAVAGATPSGSFISSAVSGTDGTSFTFTSQNIGTADATRLVVVAVSAAQSTTAPVAPTSVTVAGNAATSAVSRTDTNTNGSTASLWYIAVAAGTTATIVVTFPSTMSRCGIGVFSLLNLSSNTPFATGTSGANNATVVNPNVNVQGPNGIAMAVATDVGGGPPTWTWTGVTESYDQLMETTTQHSGGIATGLATTTPLSISATATTTSGTVSGVAASWN